MLYELLIGASGITNLLGVWTAGGAMITARSSHAGAGTQSAGLAIGGLGSTALNSTEEYDKF